MQSIYHVRGNYHEIHKFGLAKYITGVIASQSLRTPNFVLLVLLSKKFGLFH